MSVEPTKEDLLKAFAKKTDTGVKSEDVLKILSAIKEFLPLIQAFLPKQQPQAGASVAPAPAVTADTLNMKSKIAMLEKKLDELIKAKQQVVK